MLVSSTLPLLTTKCPTQSSQSHVARKDTEKMTTSVLSAENISFHFSISFMAGDAGGKDLEQTPTWAVATICAWFVIISALIEHGIHSLEMWFQKRQKKAMAEALEKIKVVLLTVGTKYIVKICIPKAIGKTMLPCKYDGGNDNGGDKGKGHGDGGRKHDRRKLLSYAGDMIWHRALAATNESPATDRTSSCTGDKVALISTNGMHQLHIFIFVLAVLHVLYSVVTIAFAQAKLKKWKAWELEIRPLEYQLCTGDSLLLCSRIFKIVRRNPAPTPGFLEPRRGSRHQACWVRGTQAWVPSNPGRLGSMEPRTPGFDGTQDAWVRWNPGRLGSMEPSTPGFERSSNSGAGFETQRLGLSRTRLGFFVLFLCWLAVMLEWDLEFGVVSDCLNFQI
ncbi:hypothetical protein SLEP1_g11216 [Rubroshorea leprosula]|uniref:MLO-like protein n=1 Tax=Rubroshorea leprosula TaxID=152421 RepID=A0AAV5IAM1_9ROSI|nr:hypothetical protein SLEP1_g11216 [Rubroshorea leprosula]